MRPIVSAATYPRAQEWIDQCETLISRARAPHCLSAQGTGTHGAHAARIPHLVLRLRRTAGDLASDHEVITVDFLGYGASDKRTPMSIRSPNQRTWSRIWQPASS